MDRAARSRVSHNVIGWIAAVAALSGAQAQAGPVNVLMDENTVIDLRAPAGDVLIGNPSIADVSLITPRRMAILGRSYGLTNVIVTDRMGHTIYRQEVNVAAAPTGRVSLYRGPLIVNFACTPHCERTPMPGEEKSANYEPFGTAYKDYEERSKADAGGQNSSSGSP